MIRTLKLENYRGFSSYELGELTRVNLLVGKNDCGKTSILEAVRLLVSRGDVKALLQAARQRGEIHTAPDGDELGPRRRRGAYDLSHHFFERRFGPGAEFRISSDDGLGSVGVKIEEAEDFEPYADDLFGTETESTEPLALRIQRHNLEDMVFSLAEDGSFSLGRRPNIVTRRRASANALPAPRPVRFLTARSLDGQAMASMWNRVLLAGRESEVIEAMRLLEEDLESIHFLSDDKIRRSPGLPSIVLGFGIGTPRRPIGSYGDGMRRLLALSLSLTQAGKGFLLIDGIDTGLHWTVMKDMWGLVVDAARNLSVQVFATTHNLDCVQGLAALLEHRPNLSDDVSVQKVERSLAHSVAFGADDIQVAADHEIELR